MESWSRILIAVAAVAVSAAPGVAVHLLDEGSDDEPAAPGAELPRGGVSVFPEFRVVAAYGAPQAEELGILGQGSPTDAASRLKRLARPYRNGGRPLLPAFELIAVIALAGAGEDGLYRARQKPPVIDRYLEAVRRINGVLLLDIQPGRSTFIAEVRALEPYLRHPDVGLAIDPEWNMGPMGVPGERIGSVRASMINSVTAYLDRLGREMGLPQKLLVIHQFTEDMVSGERLIQSRPGVDIVLNSDGFGVAAEKRAKYRQLAPRSRRFHRGFKLFFDEDTGLMSPRQVLSLRPRPVDLVIYE